MYFNARRLLLLALVLLAVLALQGCAAYEARQPMAQRGTVLVTWEIAPDRVPGDACGFAQEIATGHYLITFRRAYDFNNVCWPHEFNHAFGGRHEAR